MCISQQWNHGTEFLACLLHTSDGLCCCVSSHITGMTHSIWNLKLPQSSRDWVTLVYNLAKSLKHMLSEYMCA